MKAGNRGQWFWGVGLLIGWAGLSFPALAAEGGNVPASSLAGCEVVPVIPPEALADWKYASEATSTYGSCNSVAADGAGNLIMTQMPENLRSMGFTVFRPDGSRLWDGAVYGVNTMQLTSQSRGFLGRSYHPLEDISWLTFLDNVNQQVAVHSEQVTETMMWRAENPVGGLHELRADKILRAYSDVGQLRWSTPLAQVLSGYPTAVGVNTEGRTLVVSLTQAASGATTMEGVWVDSSGQPGTPFTTVMPQNPPIYAFYSLVPLVQGGLLLGMGGYSDTSWIASIGSLQTSLGPVPGWLADWEVSRFELLPGNRGYIRWGVANEAPSGCQLEARLTAPSGESCGTVRLPSMGTGDSCGTVSMGRDGTVVENLPSIYVSESSRPYSICRARWWPALFH
ncbi:hypothetical protein LXT21_37410 [Myxococcus sp. K38C18041901]|uniref:hypothetical protein n=1 Tax=Myxococcus guangdongensis TaxID=2906760 RepID=UPI0020A8017A|nr:hypothetical protein [Myxococcus guangdongensis]MCP3064467.1 hypothetical protein [Myxococcus guangdongensis]